MLKFYTLTIITVFVASITCVAQNDEFRNPPKFAMPILVVAPDARAGGVGDIGVATTPSANAQNWNAAKYAFVESQGGIGLSYIPWLRNVGANYINVLYLAGYYRFDERNSIAGALRYFSIGSLEIINDQGNYTNTTNPNELALDFSYTRLLSDNFSMSLTARYIRSDLAGGYRDNQSVRLSAASAVAADLGMYFNKPIFMGARTGSIAIGAAFSNIGTKMSYAPNSDVERTYFLPTTLRIGAEWLTHINDLNDISLNVELSKYLVPTPPIRNAQDSIIAGMDDNVGVFQGMIQSFYDAPGGFKEEMQEIMFGVGAEYTYARQFMARMGYYYDYKSVNRKYLTVGAGVRYQMFTLDLSYLIPTVNGFSNPLANTVRITLSADFGKVGSSRQPTPSKRFQ